MGRTVPIDPITRLEGHGNIKVIFNDDGTFKDIFLQLPDFKGFEKFCEGRAVEEMPGLTQKICGVCPTAHHIAGVKALDDLFNVTVPAAAKCIRELMHHAFIYEDHLLHFYFLGGPDFLVPENHPPHHRDFWNVIAHLGDEFGKRMLRTRRRVRELHAAISGSPLYPVCGLPGGVSKHVTQAKKSEFKKISQEALDFAQETIALFHDRVLCHSRFSALLANTAFENHTYYMGMVDEQNQLDFYDGVLRVIAPDGHEFCRFSGSAFQSHLAERVDAYSFMKPLYLKKIGWQGLCDGSSSGIYRVGPLARLNVADRLSTPLAQVELDHMIHYFGGRPFHHTFAYHWARLVEVLYAAEKMVALTSSAQLTDPNIRNLPVAIKGAGTGICEAPRGTLIHHYTSTNNGIVKDINLLVATQNNGAAIQLSLLNAARTMLTKEPFSDDMLNLLEMVFRSYDPCMACATH